jgi:hypothetical protein
MSSDEYFVNFDDADFLKRKSIVEKLLPPVIKRTPNHFESISEYLFLLWKKIIVEIMIDDEWRYVYSTLEEAYSNQDPWEDDIYNIDRALTNSELWIVNAMDIFHERISPLYSAIANDSDYFKHYSNPRWTSDSMIQKSHNAAILLPNIDINLQDAYFIIVLEVFWIGIIENENSKFILKTNELVGYSHGKECSCLLFKINKSAKLVHCYPINDNELSINSEPYGLNLDSIGLSNSYECDFGLDDTAPKYNCIDINKKYLY